MTNKVYNKELYIWEQCAVIDLSKQVNDLEQKLAEAKTETAEAVESVSELMTSLALAEQQLLEANSRLARLESVIRITVDEMASQTGNFGIYGRLDDVLIESPAQSLALHDADVVDNLNTKPFLDANVWDGEDRSGCSDDYAKFTPDELQELVDDMQDSFSEALRNSIKEGDE